MGLYGSTGPDHWGDLSKDYELSKMIKNTSDQYHRVEDVDLPELNSIIKNQKFR